MALDKSQRGRETARVKAELLKLATPIFGSKPDAKRWLNTPAIALG